MQLQVNKCKHVQCSVNHVVMLFVEEDPVPDPLFSFQVCSDTISRVDNKCHFTACNQHTYFQINNIVLDPVLFIYVRQGFLQDSPETDPDKGQLYNRGHTVIKMVIMDIPYNLNTDS